MYENFKRVLVTTDFSESGDAAIGVQLPGQNQIVPLAMAAVRKM